MLHVRARSNKLPPKILLPGVYPDKMILFVGLCFVPQALEQHQEHGPALRLLGARRHLRPQPEGTAAPRKSWWGAQTAEPQTGEPQTGAPAAAWQSHRGPGWTLERRGLAERAPVPGRRFPPSSSPHKAPAVATSPLPAPFCPKLPAAGIASGARGAPAPLGPSPVPTLSVEGARSRCAHGSAGTPPVSRQLWVLLGLGDEHC